MDGHRLVTGPPLTRDQLILQGDDITDVNENRIAQQVYTQMRNDGLVEDILNQVRFLLECEGCGFPHQEALQRAYGKYDNWLSQQETR